MVKMLLKQCKTKICLPTDPIPKVLLYPIHLTLCNDVTRKCSERTELSRAWRFCVGVFIYAIKVEFQLACVNTAPITNLHGYVTAQS